MQIKTQYKKRKLLILLSCFGTSFVALAGTFSMFTPHIMKNLTPINLTQLAPEPTEQSINLVCQKVLPDSIGFFFTSFEQGQCDHQDKKSSEIAKVDKPNIQHSDAIILVTASQPPIDIASSEELMVSRVGI